ncbi:MAG: hypothetical protein ETSY2_52920 [Candidatus Entotheonella gemina]|uniref:Response regulatory domain-containing protein n=1 Tax=Candidatus Entotheonella gemina TaxID=1429439 RepID=W4L4N2_9BACT|nr:MAG: hypothetical protein ETSY2_52920 [Candidatus Entotheonella gemina]
MVPNWQIDTANTAARGFALLQATSPGMIVLNLDLPGFDGLWFLHTLRKHLPECPAVVLATHEHTDTLQALAPLGLAWYCKHPVSVADLLTQIRTLRIDQANGQTALTINVVQAAPRTVFTVWLLLYAPNPVTAMSATPLANISDFASLAAMTPDTAFTPGAQDAGLAGDNGEGELESANRFWTDRSGNGWFDIVVDFPLVRGAYPFQAFDSRFAPVPNHEIPLAIVSHCVDDRVHGFLPETALGPAQTRFIADTLTPDIFLTDIP